MGAAAPEVRKPMGDAALARLAASREGTGVPPTPNVTYRPDPLVWPFVLCTAAVIAVGISLCAGQRFLFEFAGALLLAWPLALLLLVSGRKRLLIARDDRLGHVRTGTCGLVSLRTRGSTETLEPESCSSGTATFRGVAPGSYDLCIEKTDCHPVEVPAQPALTVQLAAQS